MTKLENFEAYHNQFTDHIPSELGLPSIKRIGKSGAKPDDGWVLRGVLIVSSGLGREDIGNSDVVVV